MKTNDIQKTVRNLGHVMSKNSPTILTGLAVAGLVSTTVLAVKATPKALELIEEERLYRESESENGSVEPFNLKDFILLTWKCYIPATAMGVVTMACIISANSINLKRNAALASMYSLSEVALKEYQAKVVETIGKNKEQKIKDDIKQDRINNNPVRESEIIVTGKGDTLCYDSLSGRYFKSDIEHIRRSLNKLARDMMSDMFISLNDVYYALDLSSTKLGDLVGWHVDDGLVEPEFGSLLTENGVPCLVLDFVDEPRYLFRD